VRQRSWPHRQQHLSGNCGGHWVFSVWTWRGAYRIREILASAGKL